MEKEMNYNFKGVVFDLDGTLMYTLDDILLKTDKFLFTPDKEKIYYESRK
mgnify:CR=1 FL=1